MTRCKLGILIGHMHDWKKILSARKLEHFAPSQQGASELEKSSRYYSVSYSSEGIGMDILQCSKTV